LSLPEFKQVVREQYYMLLIDETAALAAIRSLLPQNIDDRKSALSMLRMVLSARGEVTGESEKRMKRIVAMFESEPREARKPAKVQPAA
jgi:hypothetical protein